MTCIDASPSWIDGIPRSNDSDIRNQALTSQIRCVKQLVINGVRGACDGPQTAPRSRVGLVIRWTGFPRSAARAASALGEFGVCGSEVGKIVLVALEFDLSPHVDQEIRGPVAPSSSTDPSVCIPKQQRYPYGSCRRPVGHVLPLSCSYTSDLTTGTACVATHIGILCSYQVSCFPGNASGPPLPSTASGGPNRNPYSGRTYGMTTKVTRIEASR